MDVNVDVDNSLAVHGKAYETDEDYRKACKENREKVESLVEALTKVITELCRELSGDLEEHGYAVIQERNSDEHLTELVLINEYNFSVDGKRSVTL